MIEQVEPSNYKDMKWIIVNEDDPDTFPRTAGYILLSFANFDLPMIGRCEGNAEEGHIFYVGDDLEPATAAGLFVNAWMPYPKPLEE